jgi:hypothetical protein
LYIWQNYLCIKFIFKITLSFTPYLLFQWYPPNKEILLNLSMKCWTQHLMTRSGKRKQGMKLRLPPKLVENLFWVPVILFCKIPFLIMHLMPYYAEIGRSHPQHVAFLESQFAFSPLAFQISTLSNFIFLVIYCIHYLSHFPPFLDF